MSLLSHKQIRGYDPEKNEDSMELNLNQTFKDLYDRIVKLENENKMLKEAFEKDKKNRYVD